jgi:hypothetical protein
VIVRGRVLYQTGRDIESMPIDEILAIGLAAMEADSTMPGGEARQKFTNWLSELALPVEDGLFNEPSPFGVQDTMFAASVHAGGRTMDDGALLPAGLTMTPASNGAPRA